MIASDAIYLSRDDMDYTFVCELISAFNYSPKSDDDSFVFSVNLGIQSKLILDLASM